MKNMPNTPSLITLPSVPMQEIYHKVAQVAPTDVPILISGDTGVGKEIVARKVHDLSTRKNKPFRVINCSVFPENGLLQSEIFGHEKGAFTGATHQRKGLFEQADTGTLFLDEIGEMNGEVSSRVRNPRIHKTWWK